MPPTQIKKNSTLSPKSPPPPPPKKKNQTHQLHPLNIFITPNPSSHKKNNNITTLPPPPPKKKNIKDMSVVQLIPRDMFPTAPSSPRKFIPYIIIATLHPYLANKKSTPCKHIKLTLAPNIFSTPPPPKKNNPTFSHPFHPDIFVKESFSLMNQNPQKKI